MLPHCIDCQLLLNVWVTEFSQTHLEHASARIRGLRLQPAMTESHHRATDTHPTLISTLSVLIPLWFQHVLSIRCHPNRLEPRTSKR